MVSTPKRFTYERPRYPMTPTPVKKQSTRKLWCLFTNILDVKNKTAIRPFGAAKLKCKAIKSGATT